MDNSKRTNFDDRLSAAASAKKAELENFRARSGTNDPAIAERQAARQAISLARDARIAERNASRLVRLAREAGEKAARDAAAEAEEAAPGRRPMTSPCKPSARRPATPAMPLARHGLEKDNACCEEVSGPTGDAALDVLVERTRLDRIPL
jgi:hypothetical protein